MHEACKQLARLQKSSVSPLLMSFNVSSKQLDVETFFSDLKAAIEESDVNPACLQMEITESIFLRDADRIGQLFQDIRDLGVQIAFDDFGTGYSSLSYLEKYPIDTLKLDQSFVQNMGEGSVNAEIIRMVINLAEAIGMKTSAEGVEEEHQAAALLELGCTLAQGYLFAKPVPFARMEEMILAERTTSAQALGGGPPCVIIPFRSDPLQSQPLDTSLYANTAAWPHPSA
jgi:EAL domain-containing protein (putative c-di-GMP-specific phosphodiesterase class I)